MLLTANTWNTEFLIFCYIAIITDIANDTWPFQVKDVYENVHPQDSIRIENRPVVRNCFHTQ